MKTLLPHFTIYKRDKDIVEITLNSLSDKNKIEKENCPHLQCNSQSYNTAKVRINAINCTVQSWNNHTC